MSEYIYARIRNPRSKRLREEIANRYRDLWALTNHGEVPLKFRVKNNGKLRYDDLLADLVGMGEVLTRKNKVDIVKSVIKKQRVFPFV